MTWFPFYFFANCHRISFLSSATHSFFLSPLFMLLTRKLFPGYKVNLLVTNSKWTNKAVFFIHANFLIDFKNAIFCFCVPFYHIFISSPPTPPSIILPSCFNKNIDLNLNKFQSRFKDPLFMLFFDFMIRFFVFLISHSMMMK